jgi:hypothetical protein
LLSFSTGAWRAERIKANAGQCLWIYEFLPCELINPHPAGAQ